MAMSSPLSPPYRRLNRRNPAVPPLTLKHPVSRFTLQGTVHAAFTTDSRPSMVKNRSTTRDFSSDAPRLPMSNTQTMVYNDLQETSTSPGAEAISCKLTVVAPQPNSDLSSNKHYESEKSHVSPSKTDSVLRDFNLRISDLHDRVFGEPKRSFSSPATAFPSPSKEEVLPLPATCPTSAPHPFNPARWYGENGFRESPALWLALYFTLNLSLTLYNKSVLIRFPFPYTLTGLHTFCGSVGTFCVLRVSPSGPFYLPRIRASTNIPILNRKERVVLVMFSILYTVNIVVSNVSLRLVTVPFHQVVRASTPFFTIIFSAFFIGTRTTRAKIVSLIPVMAGVGFATYGDYYFTRWGFFLTLLGTILAAFKTTFTHLLQAPPSNPLTKTSKPEPLLPKLSLTPLQLLYLLSPLAFIQTTLLAHFTGELNRVQYHLFVTNANAGMMPRVWLLLNGVLAFGLNIVSFGANKRVGALGMSVAANVKQVLTILFAVTMFNLTITPMNGVGIVLTLIGGAWYAAVEFQEKKRKQSALRI